LRVDEEETPVLDDRTCLHGRTCRFEVSRGLSYRRVLMVAVFVARDDVLVAAS
jgi:hypothetical protein